MTTAIEPPKPTWKELQSLRLELIKSCKKKSGVLRVSAVVGFCDSLNAGDFTNKWVTLWTGEADQMDVEFVVERLTEKSRPLTLHTIRVQLISVDRMAGAESLKTSAYILHMTGAEPPKIMDTTKRHIKVAWPTINTAKIGTCDVKLHLEICDGRDWRSGKCRQSANTLSLLSSSGKRAFKSVYSMDVAEAISKGYGRRGSQQSIVITDLNPARWYHIRFRVSYRCLPSLQSSEDNFFQEDGYMQVDATGRGRAYGGIRSVATSPDVPEPPSQPRCIVSHDQRVMPMGRTVKVKAKMRLNW